MEHGAKPLISWYPATQFLVAGRHWVSGAQLSIDILESSHAVMQFKSLPVIEFLGPSHPGAQHWLSGYHPATQPLGIELTGPRNWSPEVLVPRHRPAIVGLGPSHRFPGASISAQPYDSLVASLAFDFKVLIPCHCH